MDTKVLALAKKYTDDSLKGTGALKGAPCQISGKIPIEGGTRLTFLWEDNEGEEHIDNLNVMNGEPGEKGDKGDTGPKGDPGSGGVLSSELDVSKTVGGITVGTTYAQGTDLEKILRDMLNPVEYPTLTNPSATISATGSKIIETGGELETTITVTFNRGSINPAYGTSGYRSGTATGYSLNGGETQAENTFSVTVDESNKAFTASVAYAAGEQPKDSVGDDYESPLPAGSVNTDTINYEFVNAMWANTANIGTIAKLSLVSKGTKQRDMNFPAQTVANPEVFDIPASWTVTAVQVKNDLSGAWDNASDQFTVTDVTHDDAAGTSTAYKRYTFNMGFDTGARSVRVKWS